MRAGWIAAGPRRAACCRQSRCPTSGRHVEAETAVTPGSAASRSRIARCAATIARAMSDSREPASRCGTSAPMSASNPGSIARSFWKLRSMRPDDTSSTSASATCAAHQQVPRAMAAAARRVAAPALVQRADQRPMPRQKRNRAEGHRGEQAQRERERERRRRRGGPPASRGRRGGTERARAAARRPRRAPGRARRRRARAARSRSGSSARWRGARRRARGGRRLRAAAPPSAPGTGWRRWRRRRAAPGRPTPSRIQSARATRPTIASISVIARGDQLVVRHWPRMRRVRRRQVSTSRVSSARASSTVAPSRSRATAPYV